MADSKNRFVDAKGQWKNITTKATKKKQTKAWDKLGKTMSAKKKR